MSVETGPMNNSETYTVHYTRSGRTFPRRLSFDTAEFEGKTGQPKMDYIFGTARNHGIDLWGDDDSNIRLIVKVQDEPVCKACDEPAHGAVLGCRTCSGSGHRIGGDDLRPCPACSLTLRAAQDRAI